jgi:hypothetical protein
VPDEAFLKVDLSDIAAEAMARLPSRDDQNRMVQGLGAAAMAYWKKQAQQTLRSSSREYIQALTSESEDRKFTITLGGESALPNMIEQGFSGGDMRDWMLDGPRVKRGKKGKYLVVPFQHGSKDTGGRNVGPEMPASIYQAAKKLAPTVSRPTRGGGHAKPVRYGGRLTEHSAHLNAHARKLLTTKQKPHHHSSIYRGMIREEKTFKKATQTTGYFTFRTISEKVKRGWHHPGIPAANLAKKTQRHVRKIARHMLMHSTTGKS